MKKRRASRGSFRRDRDWQCTLSLLSILVDLDGFDLGVCAHGKHLRLVARDVSVSRGFGTSLGSCILCILDINGWHCPREAGLSMRYPACSNIIASHYGKRTLPILVMHGAMIAHDAISKLVRTDRSSRNGPHLLATDTHYAASPSCAPLRATALCPARRTFTARTQFTAPNHDLAPAQFRSDPMPNIFSQLVSAFKSTGADTANDVRPFSLLSTHRSMRPTDAMPHQTDDAQPPAELPSNPFTFSPPTSPKSSTAIDLTSPPGSPQRSQQPEKVVPSQRHSGPASKRRVSDDEKRLTGDYE